jgi:hypothetical protein
VPENVKHRHSILSVGTSKNFNVKNLENVVPAEPRECNLSPEIHELAMLHADAFTVTKLE